MDIANATEAQAERAIATLKRAIDAAENSNQAGENFVVAAAAGPVLLRAVIACVDAMRAYIIPDGIEADEAMSRIVAALDNPEITPIILEAERG